MGSDGEAIALHTISVLGDHVLAIIPLRLRGAGKQHALVSSSLFVFAHTAGLNVSVPTDAVVVQDGCTFGFAAVFS